MRDRTWFGLTMAGVVTSGFTAPAAATEPLVLAPSSDWVLDYAENSCALRRSFTGGGHEAILEMDSFFLGAPLKISVMSGTLTHRRRTPKTKFEPDTDPAAARVRCARHLR